MQLNGTPAGYLREVDGLRAVAVVSVILYHLNATFLPGGFTGVDIFFVISGYVVSKSIASRSYRTFPEYLLSFYSRRIVRIFPALIVCLLLASLATVLLVPQSWLSTTTRDTGLWAFLGVSNIALITLNDGYFSPRVDFNPFVHTWSLAVEEQFYLVFPVFFFAWINWRRSAGIRASIARLILPVLALVSVTIAYWLGTTRADWAFYLLPSRFWELAAGAILFMLHDHKLLIPRNKASARFGVIAGAITIAAGFYLSDPLRFPFPWAVLPVLGTVLMINSVANADVNSSALHRLLRSPAIVYIGKISYSLYLWHWPVFVLFRWTLGLDTLVRMTSALGITFVLAVASYHFVEQAFLASKTIRLTHARTKLAAGILAIAVSLAGTSELYSNREVLSLSVTRNATTWYPQSGDLQNTNSRDGALAGKQLFVFGDSHTGAYATLFQETSDRLGLRVHMQMTGECQIANLLYPIIGKPDCEETIRKTLKILKLKSNPGDVVFLASLRSQLIGGQWVMLDADEVLTQSRTEDSKRNYERARQEAADFITAVRELNLTILIDTPKPVFPTPPFRCSDWFNRDNPRCIGGFEVDRVFLRDLQAPVLKSLEALDEEFSNLVVWDIFDLLCPGESCSPFDKNGEPLFFDGNHLSAHGNRRLYPEFEKRLLSIYSYI